MQIILKQESIEQALKQFIASQGINLSGKVVTVDFTAGRKGSGISAELNIEEAAGEQPSEGPKVSLTVLTGCPETQPVVSEAVTEPVAGDPRKSDEPAQQPEAVAEAETKTPVSLFN